MTMAVFSASADPKPATGSPTRSANAMAGWACAAQER